MTRVIRSLMIAGALSVAAMTTPSNASAQTCQEALATAVGYQALVEQAMYIVIEAENGIAYNEWYLETYTELTQEEIALLEGEILQYEMMLAQGNIEYIAASTAANYWLAIAEAICP